MSTDQQDPTSQSDNARQPVAPRDEVTRLWHAINRYAETCGGDPASNVYGNTTRQQSVVEIETELASREAAAEERGRKLGRDSEYCDVARFLTQAKERLFSAGDQRERARTVLELLDCIDRGEHRALPASAPPPEQKCSACGGNGWRWSHGTNDGWYLGRAPWKVDCNRCLGSGKEPK